MTKIKICGLTRSEDIWAANRYKPDYIGFVFAKKSRRYLTERQAVQLKRMLSDEIQAVGVFVNETKETVARLRAYHRYRPAAWTGNRAGYPLDQGTDGQTGY